MKKTKIFIILVLIVFLVVFLNTSSFAVGTLPIFCTFPSELLEIISTFDEFKTSQYGCFGFKYVNSGYRVIFVDKSIYPNASSWDKGRIGLDNVGSFIYYDFDSDYNYSRNYADNVSGYQENWYGNERLFRNITVYDGNGSIIFDGSIMKPYIANTAEDLATGKFDNVLIFPGSYTVDDAITFVVRKVNIVTTNEGSYESQSVAYSTVLDRNNIEFYHSLFDQNTGQISEFWYEIPFQNLKLTFKTNDRYIFSLEMNGESIQDISVTIGGLSQEDIINNQFDTIKQQIEDSNKKTQEALKEQTDAIKENTETNKNIFEKIGDILSFINPFSENFFVYKLIDLLINALKSLFIPSEDFFTNWIDDLNQYLSDTLGILYYPFDMVIDFLNRVSNIAESNTAIISVPEFKLEFMGNSVKIFDDIQYDLNSILENETFKMVHDIYLLFMDFLMWFALVMLCKKFMHNVFGGIDDSVDGVIDEQNAESRQYRNYERQLKYTTQHKKNMNSGGGS